MRRMRRSVVPFRIPFHGLEPLEPRQLLAQVSWDGGGGDLSWHNPLNWSGDVLPGPDDDVTVSAPGTPTISITQDVHVRSIVSAEAIHLSAGTVTVEAQWKNSAPLIMSGGELTGPGNVAIGGEGLWTGGTLGGAGKFQILPGAELSISGNVTLARELVNNGQLIWLSGNIAAHSARIFNLKDRTFIINSGGTLSKETGESLLINGGTIAVATGLNMTTIIEITLNNHARPVQVPILFPPANGPTSTTALAAGIVDVRSGTLALTGEVLQKQGAVLKGGEWWVTSSFATLLLPGPTLASVLNSTGSGTKIIMRGAGSSFPQLATAAIVTDLTLEDRAFPIVAGVTITHLTIDNPATVTVVPGPYLHTNRLDLLGGTLIVNDYDADVTFIDAGAELRISGAMHLSRGFGFGSGDRIWGGGTLRLTGEMNVEAARIEVPTFIIGPSGTLTVVGDALLLSQRSIQSRIINHGAIDWSGFDVWRIHTELVNRGTFNIRANGFVETSAGVGPSLAPATFHNFGALNVLDSAVVTFRGAGGGVRFNNHGTVQVENGRLNLFGGVTSGTENLQFLVPTWTVNTGSELAIGGLESVFHGTIIDAPGLVRIGTKLTFIDGSIIGNGETIVGPTGRLHVFNAEPAPSRHNQMARSLTINHGLIDVEGVAEIRGPLRNYGTLAVGGDLTMDRLVPFDSSVLHIRSGGPQEHGRLTVTHGGFFRGTLAIDFSWQPLAGHTFTFYHALIFNQPGEPFEAFDQIIATGLLPGRGIHFFTVAGQQTTAQGKITIT